MKFWKAWRASGGSRTPTTSKRSSRPSMPSSPHRRLSSQTTASCASSVSTTHTTMDNSGSTFVELIKRRNTDLGVLVSLDPLSRQPVIADLVAGSWAQRSDVLCIGDELVSVNGVEARLLSVDQLVRRLDQSDCVQLEVRYRQPLLVLHRPHYKRLQQTLRLTKVSGSFGMVFRCAKVTAGTGLASVTEEETAFIVAAISRWPQSPASKCGRVRVGDRLMVVNNVDVSRMRLPELQAMLYQQEGEVAFTMEYEVAVNTDTELSNTSLLVELRRDNDNEDLWMGLQLRLECKNEQYNDSTNERTAHALLLVQAVKEGSLAQRCGAVSAGDRLLAVNGVSVKHLDSLDELNSLVRSQNVLRLEVAPRASRRSLPSSPLYATHTLRPSAPTLTTTTTMTSPLSSSLPMQRHQSLTEIASKNSGDLVARSTGQRRSSFRERHKTVTFTVELDRHDVEPLGLQLSASPVNNAIFVSGLVSQGLAERSRAIQINDTLIEIDNQPVSGLHLDRVLALVHGDGESDRFAKLKLARTVRIPERDVLFDTNRLRHKPPLPTPNTSTSGSLTPGPRARATLASPLMGSSSSTSQPLSVHWVTLFKDPVYEDFGFSVSDGQHCRGVFVNRIRPAGPASATSSLRPLDRILQIDGVRTHDFDCCLAVPLIAAAGDKIEMLVARYNNGSMPLARRSFEHNRGAFDTYGTNDEEDDSNYNNNNDMFWKHSALHYIQQGEEH